MIGVDWDTVRLFLHVLAATLWVGGQLVLASLVPTLRTLGRDAPKAAARSCRAAATTVALPALGTTRKTSVPSCAAGRR